MRKNRKRSTKMSVAASRSMHFGAVIVMLFVMVIVNLLASSRCDMMMKTIGEKEGRLDKLTKDCEREAGIWDQINTAENLDRILPKLGMSMKYPRAEQVVRMDDNGRPERGQISVARAERRRAVGKYVSNDKPKPGAGAAARRR